MDSSNFKNFSRFFSLVLCTRVYLCVYLPQFEIAFEVFFLPSSRYHLYTYIYVSSFTTVYFETTFSFILKRIACAERTTSGNKFVEIDRGG